MGGASASCHNSGDARGTDPFKARERATSEGLLWAAETVRLLAEKSAVEIERSCPSGVGEVIVTGNLSLVLRRPSLKSKVVGVLLLHDTARVSLDERGLGKQAYLRMHPASLVRRKDDREVRFQPGLSCWLCCEQPWKRAQLVASLESRVEVQRLDAPAAPAAAPLEPLALPGVAPRRGEAAAAAPSADRGAVASAVGYEALAVSPSTAAALPPQPSRSPSAAAAGDAEGAATPASRAAKWTGACRSWALTEVPAVAAAPPPWPLPSPAAATVGNVGDAEATVLRAAHGAASGAEELEAPTTPPPRPARAALAVGSPDGGAGLATPCSSEAEVSVKGAEAMPRPAAFFGIADLKYDPRKPPGERVKVLELGDGTTSQFSGSGAHILEEFERSYRLVKPLNRATLVNHKAMTHDVFLDCGLDHLRPIQLRKERVNSKNLHTNIMNRLGLDLEEGEVVLKLCNCYRGAGVVVTKGKADLEEKLEELLRPRRLPFASSLQAAMDTDPDSFDEHVRHWWSNECPCFVAENRISMSLGVAADGSLDSEGEELQGSAGQERYDATMRVGFVLLRRAENAQEEEELDVEFLGAYWKLPRQPLSSEDLRGRCVSKAREGTAPVAPCDRDAVYEALGAALCQVFCSSRASAFWITKQYEGDPLMYAFTLSRYAAEQVKRDIGNRDKAKVAGGAYKTSASRNATLKDWFATSEKRLKARYSSNMDTAPANFVSSYIKRQRGVMASRYDWEKALLLWRSALTDFPQNASAHYLVGVYHLDKESYRPALDSFMRSVQLDPDFKAVYANIGVACIALADYDGAAEASRKGFERYPKAYQCAHNLAVAISYQVVSMLDSEEEDDSVHDGAQATCNLRRALALTREAVQLLSGCRVPRHRRPAIEWSDAEERLATALDQACASLTDHDLRGAAAKSSQWYASPRRILGLMHDEVPLRGWPITNYRP